MATHPNPALAEKLKGVPDKPGVYFFKDKAGVVVYVGKAASLRKRVFSYFQPTRPLSAKVGRLVSLTADLEWIITGSEAEALLFEASSIKQNQPKYNVLFRDDKSYPYIKVTIEEKFPRLFVGRGPSDPGVKTIGPFADAALLKQAISAIRRVIPFRTCRVLPKRACLDYYIGLCPAPCVEKITEPEYRENLAQVFRLLEGRKQEVLDDLQAKMRSAAGDRQYEEAAKYRDQIQSLLELAVRPRQFIPAVALADLQALLKLPRLPRRIETFDVSNIYGREAVGSMVSFVDGKPWKDGYRRFRIKTVSGIDDYAMMRELVRRRYGKKGTDPAVKEEQASDSRPELPMPDLVVIDGGKGHLAAALEVIRGELSLELPVIGIAKEFEQLFLPGRSEPIELPPQSKALQLIQRTRDEAHRFAIGYHRLLRGKSALTSALDKIPGVGPRKRRDLLLQFGSVEEIRKAPVEDLITVRGISRTLAERIRETLRKTG